MAFRIVDFDMDGTIVNYKEGSYGSSWDATFHALGLSEECKKLLDYYLWKKDLYPEWFEKQVTLLKGRSVDQVKSKILPPVYSDNAKEAFEELKKMGLYRGIITSGIDIVARYIEKDFKLDFCECNELVYRSGLFTGMGIPNVDLWSKKDNLIKVCERFGVKTEDAVVVGDHENELDLFEIAGLSMAYKPKTEKVGKAADYIINDLREVPLIIRKF